MLNYFDYVIGKGVHPVLGLLVLLLRLVLLGAGFAGCCFGEHQFSNGQRLGLLGGSLSYYLHAFSSWVDDQVPRHANISIKILEGLEIVS